MSKRRETMRQRWRNGGESCLLHLCCMEQVGLWVGLHSDTNRLGMVPPKDHRQTPWDVPLEWGRYLHLPEHSTSSHQPHGLKKCSTWRFGFHETLQTIFQTFSFQQALPNSICQELFFLNFLILGIFQRKFIHMVLIHLLLIHQDVVL